MTNELSEQSEALTPKCERFDQDIYSDVARRAQLREVRLVNSSYHAKLTEFLASERNEDDSHKQSFEGKPAEHTFSVERGIVIGTYEWSAAVKSGRRKILKLSAEYLVLYSDLKGCPEEYVQLYFKKLARFTSYPYFRAHFATQVASSGLAMAPLPSLVERVD